MSPVTAVLISSCRNPVIPKDSMLSRMEHKPYIVMITMNAKHPLRKYADQLIILPEAGIISDNTSAMPETMEFLMFTDLLIQQIQNLPKAKK